MFLNLLDFFYIVVLWSGMMTGLYQIIRPLLVLVFTTSLISLTVMPAVAQEYDNEQCQNFTSVPTVSQCPEECHYCLSMRPLGLGRPAAIRVALYKVNSNHRYMRSQLNLTMSCLNNIVLVHCKVSLDHSLWSNPFMFLWYVFTSYIKHLRPEIITHTFIFVDDNIKASGNIILYILSCVTRYNIMMRLHFLCN